MSDMIQAAVEEYFLQHPSENEEQRFGRNAAVRGIMMRMGVYAQFCAALDDKAMRPETGMEHIARDMREGRFPERSAPQMVPLAALPPANDARHTIRIEKEGDVFIAHDTGQDIMTQGPTALQAWERLAATIAVEIYGAPATWKTPAPDAVEALVKAAEAWEAFKAASTTVEHWKAVERLDALFAAAIRAGGKP